MSNIPISLPEVRTLVIEYYFGSYFLFLRHIKPRHPLQKKIKGSKKDVDFFLNVLLIENSVDGNIF